MDQFSPGGLTNKNDIKLLICYILSGIEGGLSKKDIISILNDNNIANYFDATDAFSDAVSKNLICIENKDDSIYTVTDSGKMISAQLDVSLPISIREKALNAAINTLTKVKLEKENTVEINKTELGYSVTCNISGGNVDLMSLMLYVPDAMQANMVKENFHADPELVYSSMLAVLTQNKDLLKENLEKLSLK